MTDTYPNAAPPPGALFDNAPSVVAEKYAATFGVSAEHARMLIDAVVAPAPVHLTPAARVFRDRGGRWQAVDVWMQYGAPIPLALAVKRVAIGRTVFVRREDKDAVIESLTPPAVESAPVSDA